MAELEDEKEKKKWRENSWKNRFFVRKILLRH